MSGLQTHDVDKKTAWPTCNDGEVVCRYTLLSYASFCEFVKKRAFKMADLTIPCMPSKKWVLTQTATSDVEVLFPISVAFVPQSASLVTASTLRTRCCPSSWLLL